jgi:DNA-binding IclR family transcriptional regulator
MQDRPPATIDGLLEQAVDSVGTVELLLLMRSEDGRPRSVAELSAALRSPGSWTESQLAALAGAGLVAQDGDGGWRYAPTDERLARAADELAAAWRRDRRAVRRWVFTPRRSAGRRGRA